VEGLVHVELREAQPPCHLSRQLGDQRLERAAWSTPRAAQRSTTTGSDDCSTSVANVASVTVTGVRPHIARAASARRSAGTRFNVRGIPTLLVLKVGKEIDRIVGAQPKVEIVRRLERHIA
jgi:thiol-disulfide isomerase/thioredoxin